MSVSEGRIRRATTLILILVTGQMLGADLPTVAPQDVVKADSLLTAMASDDFETREKASRDLQQLFKPATKDRAAFWDAWLKKKLEAAKDNSDLNARLQKLSPLEVFELKDAYSRTDKASVYAENGRWTLHGASFEYLEGKLRWKFTFEHGALNGEVVIYRHDFDDYENYSYTGVDDPADKGQPPKILHLTVYRDGIQDGPVQHYHPNGQLSYRGQMHNGVDDGDFVAFDENGRECGRYTMRSGTGTTHQWSPSGKLEFEAELEDGLFSGRRETWDSSGRRRELSHHKYVKDAKVSVPNGTWEGWATKKIAEPEKRVELTFQDGAPSNGRMWAKLGSAEAQWLYFEEGKILTVAKGGVEKKHLGDFAGELAVITDYSDAGKVEIKDSRLLSGRFFGYTYENGKCLGRKRSDNNKYVADKLLKLLATQAPAAPSSEK